LRCTAVGSFADGGSAREVLDAARAKHITDPLVFA